MRYDRHRFIEAPYAWKGADMQHKTHWLRPFSADELAEIDAALQAVKRRGLDLFDIDARGFPAAGDSRRSSRRSRRSSKPAAA